MAACTVLGLMCGRAAAGTLTIPSTCGPRPAAGGPTRPTGSATPPCWCDSCIRHTVADVLQLAACAALSVPAFMYSAANEAYCTQHFGSRHALQRRPNPPLHHIPSQKWCKHAKVGRQAACRSLTSRRRTTRRWSRADTSSRGVRAWNTTVMG